jgi:tetratricopeptide (TPR) repeat protein
VNEFIIGLVGALVATNQPLAVSNLIQQNIGVSVAIVNPSDPAEQELQKLMTDDDAAQAEVDKWIRDNNSFAAQGAGESRDELNKSIFARFDSVRKNYEDFLRRYPTNARGYLAYGSFLNDIGEEDEAMLQYESARQLDPKNPAAWNNLANYFGEHGPVTNAFAYYAEALKLNPSEPVYYENLATTVYLFRKDAREFYGINEQQVFNKALELYRKAVQLDPDNFPLATDYAQSYYGIRPLRTNDALEAWTNALNIAHDDIEREGVYIHLARIKIAAGRFDEARTQLDAVTNSMYANLKVRLERNLAERENAATNPVVAVPANPSAGISANAVVEETNAVPILINESVSSVNAVIATNSLSATTNESPAPVNPPPVSTNVLIAQDMAAAASNIIADLPTNGTVVTTNVATVSANKVEISTNISTVPTNPPPVLANEVPALTNPPPFSTNIAPVLTNVPPSPPEPLQMQMPPPFLRLLPQTPSTNAP